MSPENRFVNALDSSSFTGATVSSESVFSLSTVSASSFEVVVSVGVDSSLGATSSALVCSVWSYSSTYVVSSVGVTGSSTTEAS